MTDIKELIPHRPPFLYVDKLISADEKMVIGERTFDERDDFFKGHFPGHPIVPGVIMIEAMAQCGGAGARAAKIIGDDKLFFLAAVEKCRFKRQVLPGDTVRYEVTHDRVSAVILKQSGKVFVGDELAAEASWTCMVAPSAKTK
jgi:3-hydroxyacyl-[acyl-carrier-protein] dehydratase